MDPEEFMSLIEGLDKSKIIEYLTYLEETSKSQ